MLFRQPDAADAERCVSKPPKPSCATLIDISSPLKPEELQVLRGQYEKEGDFVGVQTKFNYAWVSCLRHFSAAYIVLITLL